MKKQISTSIGIIITAVFTIIIFGGVLAYQYFVMIKIDSIQTVGRETYTNNQYGFRVSVPELWKGYSIQETKWDGLLIGTAIHYGGPKIIIKNIKLEKENGFSGIPVMVVTPDVWKLMEEEKIAVSAAPIGPSKIGENSKYVFATPPRFIGFADDLNVDQANEVFQIIKTFKGF